MPTTAAQFADELARAGVNLNKLDLSPLGEKVGILIRGIIEVNKQLGTWITSVKGFLDALNLTGPALAALKQGLINASGPGGQLAMHIWDTGKAAVAADKAQAAFKAQIDLSTESGRALLAQMAANEVVARGAIASVKGVSTAEIEATAGAAQNKIVQTGEEGGASVEDIGSTGVQQMQLTQSEILAAANALAEAFKTGMGQSISPALQALVTATRENMTMIGTEISKIASASSNANAQLGSTVANAIQSIGNSAAANDRAIGSAIAAVNNALVNAVNALQSQINALAARR